MKDKIIGAALLAWFAAVVISRVQLGFSHNIWWVSHTVLLLAGIAFLLDSDFLMTGAMVLILIPHSFWIIDFFLVVLGLPSFGITRYVLEATFPNILFTLHHFALIPLLLWKVHENGTHSKGWLAASGYFALTTLGALLFTNPDYNVSCAFRVCEIGMLNFLGFLNKIPLAAYWLAETALMSIFIFFSVNKVLGRL